MEKERRKHKRINKTMAVQIEDSYGMLIDLSKGGLRIIPDTLPKNIEDIRICFITEDGEPIELRGSITRIVDRKEKEGKYELGLAIRKSTENYTKYIEALEKDESPSGIFQENVRQDLVKAVLEGKEEDLSIPKSEAPDTLPPAPYEAVEEDNLNIPLEDLLHEEPEPDFPEPTLAEPRGTVSPETIDMPVGNGLPPPDKPVPEEKVNIPLDEEPQLEQQPEAAGTPSSTSQDYTPDETIVMPANRLPYVTPQAADAATPSSDKKKVAPQRVEISFEEFLQKNPQFNRPVAPPIRKTPPPEDDPSLDKVFHDETQAGQPAGPSSPAQVSPNGNEESLDRVFKESPQPVPPPKTGEEKEEDMSLDNLFKEQDKS